MFTKRKFAKKEVSTHLDEKMAFALLKVAEGYLPFDRNNQYIIPSEGMIDDFLDYDDMVWLEGHKSSSSNQKELLYAYYLKLSHSAALLSSFKNPVSQEDFNNVHEHISELSKNAFIKGVASANYNDFLTCHYAVFSGLKSICPNRFVVDEKMIFENLTLDKIIETSLRDDISLVLRGPIKLYLNSLSGYDEDYAFMGSLSDRVYAQHLFNVISSASEYESFLEKVNIHLCEVKM